jgi:phosphoesterase RecJ-like protein
VKRMNSLEEIAELLLNLDNYTIVSHIIPDGDCVGSMLGLYLSLKKSGKQVIMTLSDPVPEKYYYLPQWDKIKKPSELDFLSENVIFLDCADKERAGEEFLALLSNTATIINIDHHLQCNLYGNYNYVKPQASATGEIIFSLLQNMKMEISKDIADCLYAAIVMDTGSFMNSNTTSDTMRITASLLDAGANVDQARIRLFESKPRKEVLMLGKALQHIGFSDDGKIAWLSLSYDEAKGLNALDFHPEGIINYTRMINGVQVGILFRETEPGVIKIGFRSKGDIDVAKIAAKYNGGGHRQAAGASQEGTLEEVQWQVINTVKDVIC